MFPSAPSVPTATMPLRMPPSDGRLVATGRDPMRVLVAVSNPVTAASQALLGSHLARRSGGVVTLIEVRDSAPHWTPHGTSPRVAAVDIAADALAEAGIDSDVHMVWSALGTHPDRRRREIARSIAKDAMKTGATVVVVGAGAGGFGGFGAGVAEHLRRLTRVQVVEVPVGYSFGVVSSAQSLAWI